jgi:hypothetical protein
MCGRHAKDVFSVLSSITFFMQAKEELSVMPKGFFKVLCVSSLSEVALVSQYYGTTAYVDSIMYF